MELPQELVSRMKNPLRMDDFGIPLETSVYLNVFSKLQLVVVGLVRHVLVLLATKCHHCE